MRSIVQGFVFVMGLMVTATVGPALAQAPPTKPTVFKTYEELLPFGIAFDEHVKQGHPHKCYSYGDGSTPISVSDALLARYKAKGFTLESLCLGLISEARFDPESGKPLVTYIVFHEDSIRAWLKDLEGQETNFRKRFQGRDPKTLSAKDLSDCCSEGGYITEELPLTLPACFKNGTPYLDCRWAYAIKTGARLTDASIEKFRNLGKAVDAAIRTALAQKSACTVNFAGAWPCQTRAERNERGYLQPSTASVVHFINEQMVATYAGSKPLPEALLKGQNLSFLVASPNLPRGYGYALYAEGDAGPGISIASLRQLIGGSTIRTQVDLDRLKAQVEE